MLRNVFKTIAKLSEPFEGILTSLCYRSVVSVMRYAICQLCISLRLARIVYRDIKGDYLYEHTDREMLSAPNSRIEI